jgi:alkylhydroperoxidase family enzyme
MSLRRAVARPAGVEDLLSEGERYEESAHLTDAQKSALRMHDAFLSYPPSFGHELRAEALRHYSPAQIVELAFKFLWWSTNRATVTLGGDAPHDPTRLTPFHYDETGAYVVDGG